MNGLTGQIDALVRCGLPARVGHSAAHFRETLERLAPHVPPFGAGTDLSRGTVGAVIVIRTPALPARTLLTLIRREGLALRENLRPKQVEDFQPLPEHTPPPGDAYLLLHVDRGDALSNAIPLDAHRRLQGQGRLPLTVEEGASLLLLWPGLLQRNRCFMVLGSRCGDRRVPAFWLSGAQPKLGWCWEGNPHTWLGFASCAQRSPGVWFDDALRP